VAFFMGAAGAAQRQSKRHRSQFELPLHPSLAKLEFKPKNSAWPGRQLSVLSEFTAIVLCAVMKKIIYLSPNTVK
jgi:hypothetical protein